MICRFLVMDLRGWPGLLRADYSTFDILKEYYQDKEEDMYWAEGQLELVKLIGKENWYIQQL